MCVSLQIHKRMLVFLASMAIKRMAARCLVVSHAIFGFIVDMFSIIAIFMAFWTISVSRAELYSSYVDGRLLEDSSACAVPALTSGGRVCGTVRDSYKRTRYASFRGVPYARPPLDELRFMAPQPLEPWNGYLNASIEGPVCPQPSIVNGPMFQPISMGEDCLHANVHVPTAALPDIGSQCSGDTCLPVLVFIHGGGFQVGSGDSDMNGPEYMMDHNIVLITINYRLGPFGFLSLNTSTVPGNAGLRDMVAALQWVQHNARAFGGDPNHVTLMGQSAGAAAAHLLSLSDTTRGLFNKAILMSDTSGAGFFSTKPNSSQYLLKYFLKYLSINSTDIEDIHSRLIKLPYKTILEANSKLIEFIGDSGFNPVVESHFDGVTRILEDDPDSLVACGKGINYPLIIGFTNVECESLRSEYEDILDRIKKNITAVLPPKLTFAISEEAQIEAAKQIMKRYFQGTPSVDKYIASCTDSHQYAPIKLAQTRATTGGAPVFLYQFSYGSDSAPPKIAFHLKYSGAGHFDDLSYVLRVNSMLQNRTLNERDNSVIDWMTDIVVNFVRCSAPSWGPQSNWPAATRPLLYQDIRGPAYSMAPLSVEQREAIQLFDGLYQL